MLTYLPYIGISTSVESPIAQAKYFTLPSKYVSGKTVWELATFSRTYDIPWALLLMRQTTGLLVSSTIRSSYSCDLTSLKGQESSMKDSPEPITNWERAG